jgi:hypothetical protein
MKLRLLALAATAATALAASTANAAITSAFFDPLAWGVNAGETDITQFEGGPALANTTFLAPGYSISGNAQLFTGSVGGVSAAPAVSSTSAVFDGSGHDGSQYLSVQGGETATLTLAGGLTEISFYIGSIDTYNTMAFHYADGTFEVPINTGAWVSDNTITQSNGDQQSGNTNGRLTLTFDKPIDSVILGSGSNAFEISDVAGIAAGVPEPTSWALMLLGFGGAGAALRAQRRRPAVAATA